MKQLNEAGYNSGWDYFLGCSKYNGFLVGWAGHTQDGEVFSNVSGCNFLTFILLVVLNVSFCCRHPIQSCEQSPQSSEGRFPLPDDRPPLPVKCDSLGRVGKAQLPSQLSPSRPGGGNRPKRVESHRPWIHILFFPH